MSDPVAVVLTGQEMFKIRERAIELALQANAFGGEIQTGKALFDAGAYLNFLLNGLPIDEVPGSISAPKPNTPEILANAGVVTPAQEATPSKPPKVTKPKLAAVPTSASAATSPSAAPVQAASPVNTGQTAAGSVSTNSAQTNSPQIVAQPTNIQDAANSLKALVQDDVRGVAAGYADPGAGRKAAVAILESFGVTQMGQIPPAKLADFKAKIDAAGKTLAPAAAVAGSDLL